MISTREIPRITVVKQFEGKVAVVTGGGSGIGEAVARRLSLGGARIVVADLDTKGAERVAQSISDSAGAAEVIKADVSDPASMGEMVDFAVKKFGKLDVAINNAGIAGVAKPVGEMSPAEWLSVINVNLNGVFYSMHAEIRAMLQAGGGAIVNISSVLGSVGFATASAYVAAKHALLGLTKTAALEYGTQGIRVNAVGPGFIMTPLLTNHLDESALKAIAAMHALHRLGTADEVAALVAFLASDDASFITGSYHLVDGGYSAQ